jgi:hypothetical protein
MSKEAPAPLTMEQFLALVSLLVTVFALGLALGLVLAR